MGTLLCLAFLSFSPNVYAQSASKKYGELLKRLPETANMIMLIDVDGLLATPMAEREGWRAQLEQNASRGLGLSPEISRMVVASSIDLPSFDERWKLGMAELRSGLPDIAKIAENEGGYVEPIGTTPAAWSPRGITMFTFPPNIFAFAETGDRQSITTWLERTMLHPRLFPPSFADRAIFRADAGSQIVLVINLDHAISARALEPALASLEAVQRAKLDPQILAERLASAKFAFIQIDVKENIQGQIRVEFEKPVDFAAPVLKEIVLTALEENGFMLPDFNSWIPAVDRQQAFELSGNMTTESAQAILSLSRPPALVAKSRSFGDTPPPAEPGQEAAPPAKSNDVVAATKGYFNSVVDVIETLKGRKGANTYASMRIWYDRSAKEIEQLPLLGVDKDVLDWGSKVARTFREMAYGINYSAKNQTYTLASQPNGYGGYYYGGYGYVTASSKGYNQATIKRQADAVLSTDLDARFQVLETTISDLRRAMTEKYQVEF